MNTSEVGERSIPEGGHLSIGTVSKLTGISVHTLRAWEKRHRVVEVVRSSTGRRLYSGADVHRLRLLKRLIQSGHSIGNIAALSNQELEGMLQLEFYGQDELNGQNGQRPEVCLFSDKGFDNLIVDAGLQRKVDIVVKTTEIGRLREALATKKAYNLVFIFGTIAIHQLRMLRQLKESENDHRFIIVFSAAQRDMIDEMVSLDFVLLRAPISYANLFQKVLDLHHGEDSDAGVAANNDEAPPHKFTKRQLELLANHPSAIDCECPHHIAHLVRSLTMFESYCQNCSSKNEEDAYLHNEIYKMTAQARSTMEKAISLLIEAEHINLGSRTAES